MENTKEIVESKKTLILGASTNPARYAYLAAQRLYESGHEFVLLGVKKGEVLGQAILNGKPELTGIDTVTLYIGAAKQPEWYAYLLSLKPKRIIFNPGTENPELMRLALENNIQPLHACTLVLLATGQY